MVVQCEVGALEEGACGWGLQRRVEGHEEDLGPSEEDDPWGDPVLDLQNLLLWEGHLWGHPGVHLLDQHSVGAGSCSGLQIGARPAWWRR